ncbi:MAG: divalent-cation tolerance protein CutA [Candidatus Aenigmarchaeota archaeon]|nr:divalent-cation tolerance protein CutA [Candidatus Aenigmarchaeota archaeon]
MIVVYFTAKDEKEGLKIGEVLVKEKIAACSNVFPIKSIYRWKGEVRRGREVAVFVKTKNNLYKKVVKRIRELHSYELPVIEKYEVKTYPELERWIRESVKSNLY